MGFAPHATREDMIGADGVRGFLRTAEAAEFATWDEDDVDRALEEASLLIEGAISRAVVERNADGTAADPHIADVLKRTVGRVIQQWLEVSEENDIDGLAGQQISVPGFSGRRAPTMTARALRELRIEGLLCQPEVTR